MNNDFSTLILFALLINIPSSLVVGYVASQKGRSGYGFFFLSFFFSFALGILAVIALPQKAKDFGATAVCAFCKEDIRFDAQVCRHCGKDVVQTPPEITKELNTSKVPEGFRDSYIEYTRNPLSFARSKLTLPEAMRWEKLGKPDLNGWFERGCPPLIPWMEDKVKAETQQLER